MDALNTPVSVDIYNNMVAGSFPLGEGINPVETVRMLAQEVLHAQDIHMRHSIDDGHVFYIACNSRSLASSPQFTTALAAGLPGHVAHKGDGCYFLPLPPNNAACLVRRGHSLKLFVNFSETVLESCVDEALPRIDVTESSAESLDSQAWVYRKLSNRISGIASMASLGVIGLSILIVLGSNASSGFMAKGRSSDVVGAADKANALIESTSFIQPLAETLNRVQTLSYSSVASGGWIDGYNYKNGQGERFVVSLPSWVTQDAVKSIGDGVKTEAQPGGNLIWVTKADSKGNIVKARGPADIPVTAPPTAGGPAKVAAAEKPANADKKDVK